jgi:hypothetical protein
MALEATPSSAASECLTGPALLLDVEIRLLAFPNYDTPPAGWMIRTKDIDHNTTRTYLCTG